MNYRLTAIQAALLRGLRRLLAEVTGPADSPPSIVVDRMESTPWASLTYVGEQHRIGLRLLSPVPAGIDAGAGLMAAADSSPPSVPGAFVADMTVAAVRGPAGELSLSIEVLTIEE